jgi:DNA-binding GntR family transcriptional regulator
MSRVNTEVVSPPANASSPRAPTPATPATPAELVPLTQTNLREQARRAIRAHIIAGNIAAGELLSARALAGRLGVSATPVREALLDLAKERLLTPVRNQGFQVTTPSEQDMHDILEMRLLLEVPAMVRLSENPPLARRVEFENLAARIQSCASSGDVVGFLEADRDFHLGMLEELGNRRLVETIAVLRDQVRLYGLRRLAEEQRLSASADEHVELLQAIFSSDPSLTEEVMRRHLVHTTGIWAGHVEAEQTQAAGNQARHNS